MCGFANAQGGTIYIGIDDAVPVDNIGIEDLDQDSIEIFKREAFRKQRMEKEDLDIPNDELMDHLDLLVDGKLKRAAVMLFYRKPGRIITGSYVKIGKFGEGSDLQYQDIVEGSLFNIADKVISSVRRCSAKYCRRRGLRILHGRSCSTRSSQAGFTRSILMRRRFGSVEIYFFPIAQSR